ncbi:hypothetical protein D3C84_544460 [compost metagenome]
MPCWIQSSPSLPKDISLARAARMKSLPAPPKISDSSSILMMKSWPKPPMSRSTPWTLSSPPRSVMMSSPAPPNRKSLPSPPSSRSLPSSPCRVSSPMLAIRVSLPALPPSTTWSSPRYCRKLALRRTSGSNGLSPRGSSRKLLPRPVNCCVGSTSRVKAGVEKISPGRWVASVLADTSLAKELFSSSVRKFRPAVRSR